MSDPDRDLRAPVSTPGRARATANQIKAMWGEILIEGDVITRTGMYARREVWIRVPGSGTGASALFERQGED